MSRRASPTWHADQEAVLPAITPLGWVRFALRLIVLAIVLFGGLGIVLLCRMIERPLLGERRPVSQWLPHWCCGLAVTILGLRFRSRGEPMRHPGAQVANHVSWIDIYALYRRDRVYFAAKSEVARWPAIGLLSRSVGTLFVSRQPAAAAQQRALLGERLRIGHRLVFFPEGTSTDGSLVLPFKSTLFAAFFDEDVRDRVWIQPVTTRYVAPQGAAPSFYGWYGDTDFAPHFLAVLAAPRHGAVEVIYHPPLKVSEYKDRKALAAAAEEAVRSGLGA